MAEQILPADGFKVAYICDQCGKSEVFRTGSVFDCNPPRYLHECPECQWQVYLDQPHPYMKFVPQIR